MNCRRVRDLLPEYVAGRFVPDRERIAGHLSHCEECDAARRDVEAVFALLAAAPEPPETMYGEANARFALQSEFAPGPLRSMEAMQRREDKRLAVSAALSCTGTALLGMGALYLRRNPLTDWSLPEWASNWASLLRTPYALWMAVAAFVLAAGLAAMLPALILHAQAAPPRRVKRGV